MFKKNIFISFIISMILINATFAMQRVDENVLINKLEVLKALKKRNNAAQQQREESKQLSGTEFSQTESWLKTMHGSVSDEAITKAIIESNGATVFWQKSEQENLGSLVKKIMAQEKAHINSHYVFYHAYQGYDKAETKAGAYGPGLIFDVNKEIFEWLHVVPMNNQAMLRIFDKGFEKYSTIQNFLEKFPYHLNPMIDFDHCKEFRDHAFSVNLSLFGNNGYPGESSFDFFIRSQSIATINASLGIEEIFDAFNFDKKYIEDLLTLYKKLMEDAGGCLLQIFVTPDIVDSLGYLSYSMGHKNDSCGKRLSTALEVYKTDPLSIEHIGYGWFKQLAKEADIQEFKRDMFNQLQARLLLKPSFWADATKIKVFKYYAKKNIDEVHYKKEHHKIFKEIIKDWIKNYHLLNNLREQLKKYSLVKDLFQEKPALQKMLDCMMYAPREVAYEALIKKSDLKEINSDTKNFTCSTSIMDTIPLVLAARYNKPLLLKCILDVSGANLIIDEKDSQGYSALMVALDNGAIEMVTLLLELGACVNQEYPNRNSLLTNVINLAEKPFLRQKALDALRLLLEHGASINVHNFTDRAPLVVAVARNQEDILKVLMASKNRPDLNIIFDNKGRNLLSILYKDFNEADYFRKDCLTLLVKYGLDLKKQFLVIKNNQQISPEKLIVFKKRINFWFDDILADS